MAVVVPDTDVLPVFAKSGLGLDSMTLAELCESDKVKRAIMEGMAKSAKEFQLKGFEQVRTPAAECQMILTEVVVVNVTSALGYVDPWS